MPRGEKCFLKNVFIEEKEENKKIVQKRCLSRKDIGARPEMYHVEEAVIEHVSPDIQRVYYTQSMSFLVQKFLEFPFMIHKSSRKGNFGL